MLSPSENPSPIGPSAHQHLPGNSNGVVGSKVLLKSRLGTWSWGLAPPGRAPAPRAPPPLMALVQSPRREKRREIGERRQEGEKGGSAAQFVAKFFFFSFFPFFLSKKCMKAGSLFARSAVFPGEGAGRGPSLAPSLQLKVASYCLETVFQLNTRQ